MPSISTYPKTFFDAFDSTFPKTFPMINSLAESVSKAIYCAKNVINTKIYSVHKKYKLRFNQGQRW